MIKKINLLITISLFFCAALFAQSVPQGMNYQAVARDADGQVIANEEINLKISLLGDAADGKLVYSEYHRATTNEIGLFTLTIGEGKTSVGTFTEVPWSSSEIWMNIALAEGDDANYKSISTTRLLAVPYAFHAGTADGVTGENPAAKLTGPYWKSNGNQAVTAPYQFLGTVDNNPLIIKTNNQERMTVAGDGDISFTSPLAVDNTLSVDGIASFNNTTESTTKDNGAVIVEGGVGIEKNINVGGNAAVDGTLGVDGIATINNTTESTTKDNGAVVVEGGLGVEKNANIGGNLEVDGTLGVDGVITLKNTTESTTKDNGALVIEGGLGVEKNANIGGNLEVDGTLGVDGVTTLKNTTESTTKDNGALVIEGGLGVEKNANIGGELSVNNKSNLNGQVKIDASLQDAGAGDNYDRYPLQVEGSGQGIAINVNAVGGSSSGRSNNYISFWKGDTNMTGRIEGMNTVDLDPTGLTDLIFDDFFSSGFGGGNAGISIEDIGDIILDGFSGNTSNYEDDADGYENVIPNQTEIDNFNSQIFSNYTLDIILQTTDIIKTTIMFAASILSILDPEDIFSTGVDLLVEVVNIGIYIVYSYVNLGVAYESGSGDYAEWLLRADEKELLTPGEVVGVVGGKVSKEFDHAEKFMVISTAPALLGNMPEIPSMEFLHEKVAFMGQVPVKVIGEVNIGDFILPSGNGDGFAMAVAPEDMQAKDYGRIVGIAWQVSDGKKAFDYINTAVGINSNNMAGMIDNMQSVMNEMQMAIKEINPNYEPKMFNVTGSPNVMANAHSIAPTMNQHITNQLNLAEDATLEEKMQALKQYAYDNGAGEYLEHYPHFFELLENPNDMELVNKVIGEYTQALQNAQTLVTAIENARADGK